MSALTLLDDCLNILKTASDKGQDVQDLQDELHILAQELNVKLQNLDKVYSTKIRKIFARYYEKNKSILDCGKERLSFSKPLIEIKPDKQLYFEMISICEKIEIAYKKAQDICNVNEKNFLNQDQISKKLNELSIFKYRAKKIRQRQATSSSQTLEIIENLKKMLNKSESLIIDITEGACQKLLPQLASESPLRKSSTVASAESTNIFETHAKDDNHSPLPSKPLKEHSTLTNNSHVISFLDDKNETLIPEIIKEQAGATTSVCEVQEKPQIKIGSQLSENIVQFSDKSDIKESQLEDKTKINNFIKSNNIFATKESTNMSVSEPSNEKKIPENTKKISTLFDLNTTENEEKNPENTQKISTLFDLNTTKNEEKNPEKDSCNHLPESLPTPVPAKPVDRAISPIKSTIDLSKPLIENFNRNKSSSKVIWERFSAFAKNSSIPAEDSAAIKKFINISINTLSRNSGKEIIKRSKNFIELLNKRQIDTPQGQINLSNPNLPDSLDFATFHLFKNIHSQIENIISASSEAAYPICILVNSLFQSVPCFYENFKSFFLYKYPLFMCIIPGTEEIVQIKETAVIMNSKSYDESTKAQYIENLCKQYESASIFIGLACTINLPINLEFGEKNINNIGFLWSLLTYSLHSLKTNPDISISMMFPILKYCGSILFKVYSNQFQKLMRSLSQYLESLKSIQAFDGKLSTNAMNSKVKLEDLVTHFKEHSSFQPPEGMFDNNFWNT